MSSLSFESFKGIKQSAAKSAIRAKLGILSSDPYKIAKRTTKPIIGEYYVKAGAKYSITFNIDDQQKIIKVLGIYRNPYLYRMIMGHLSPPTGGGD